MKIDIKNILRESLIKESVNTNNLPNGQIQFLCTNEKGEKVGFALLTPTMDVEKYVSNSYEDPDNDYLDPDLGRHFPEGKAAKFERVYVYPKFRDDKVNRYGAQLINSVKDYCKQNGIKTILLTASPIALKDEAKISSEALVNIYQKYGFQVVKVNAGHDMVAQLEEGGDMLDEDLEMHSEIDDLAEDILKKVSISIAKRAFQTKSLDFTMPIILDVFNNLYPRYTKLVDFMKDFSLRITIVDINEMQPNGRYVQSSYNSGNIIIKLNYSLIRKVVERDLSKYFNDALSRDLLDYAADDILFSLRNNELSEVIVHELQHAYDSWRSGIKYHNTKRKHDYFDKYGNNSVASKEQHLQYLKMQHEINARFSEAIKKTYFSVHNYDRESGLPMDYLIMLDFKKILDDFKKQFVGFEVMTPSVKERLLNRFVKIYYEKEAEIKQKNEEQLNKKRG